ncbi:nitrate reductase [Vibrio albus]|uniref:Nitrate reductase n=1 Tax=Vibrio albus TaxID=2200953 RepID=A0A2U3B9T5_9VIBR|nr:nitrate reductase [Vibrio albus]PWI33552.1 nitrate reductase [Vibrio albus]
MMQSNDGWIKTTCAYCGVGCGVEARPNMSGELEVRGDKSHPSNYGKLCTKGIALGDTVIHDGRLLAPIDKRTAGGEELDWHSATQIIADNFSKAIKEHGPDSVAFYVSGQLLTEDYYVANKLIKGFLGTANIDSNSRLCMASSVVGHKRAFGSDTVPVCYDDLEQAELVVLVGSNLAWCHPVLFQRLRSAKQNNPSLRVVVIDPRRTDSCDIADEHLALNSGSDVALFNGLLTHIAEHGCLDDEFVSNHTNNAKQALDQAAQESDIESLTGLSQEQLQRFYQDFVTTDKVITVYSQGVNQSTTGSDKVNSIINCHLATGKVGKEGTGPFSVTGQPNAMGGREVGALANTLASHMEFDKPEHLALVSNFWGTENLASKPGLKAVDMFDAMAEGKIKAVWIMATNPMVSLPDSEKIRKALETCEFVAVSDCIADTETTRMADIVLPAQGWSEKSGTVTNSERRISRQRRVMPSPGMAKPDWWIISQVAQKMGFGEAFDYLHEGEIFREYAALSTQGNQNGERDFSLIGLTQLDDKGYSQLLPQQWPVTELQSEVVNQRLFSDKQFYTPDRKANFVPVRHSAPKSVTSEAYPLLLNSGRTRDQWHTMSRTGLSARLGEHKSEPYVQIHPHTANEYRVQNGQLVLVSSAQGKCQVRAEVTSEVSPGQLFIPIHWNNLTAKDAKPCDLIAPYTDNASGQPEFKHTPVTLQPCLYQSAALFTSRHVMDFDKLDYWARQKIEHGYLYRIESTLSVYELAQQLKSHLTGESDRIASYESGMSGLKHRFVSVVNDKVSQEVYVQPRLSETDISSIIENFNRHVDSAQESVFPDESQLVS